MITIDSLITRVDDYKKLSGIPEDSKVSWRIFGDSKKLSALRSGGDITVTRFNSAMRWLDANWPETPEDAA